MIAREKHHQKIVNLLSKKPKQTATVLSKKPIPDKSPILEKNSDSQVQSLKQEIESLRNKNDQLENKNKQLQNENQKLELKNQKNTDEINKLKSFLLALKEKSSDIEFVDLDDYKDESYIGEGGTSSVKIVILNTTKKYALKELKEFSFKTLQRFVAEGEILFKLRHPCIIRIHGMNYGDDKHPPSIVLSLEPKSLESAINFKELNNHQKNMIAVEIVLGMRYIHSRNFMHRDLKPTNILLSKNMHVRISDFGLAKEENLEMSQSKGIGTLRFMAPELFEENDSDTPYNNKVDVYSFGITLIFIVTNSYPKFSLKNAMIGKAPSLPDSIVSWVRELINRCLSLEPEDRPTFSEIFEIMRSNKFDMFNEKQKKDLKEIENRILKIEAFEYQHQND